MLELPNPFANEGGVIRLLERPGGDTEALVDSVLAKRYASNACLKITDNAVQVLGGHGYVRDHPVEMWLRNARGFSSFEGMAIV